MTKEKFVEIIYNEKDYKPLDGDGTLHGANIMAKYVHYVIQGADHDKIYGPDIDDLIAAGITEEDTITLRNSGWLIHDDSYMIKGV